MKIFITKYEWEVSQAEPEFSIIRKFTAKSGELEIASLNSGRSLPSLEYAYFLVWAKGGNSCAIEIRHVPPSSNITRFGIQEIEISSTTIEGVYQIQVTTQTDMINPDAENPNLTLRQFIAKDRSLIQITKDTDVKFHAAEIPIYDSGDGTQKKSKPHELMLNLDVTGSLEITAKTSAIAKQQKPWIGKYLLNFEPSSTTSQPVTLVTRKKIDAAYKIALALFKSGKPGPAAETLAQALTLTSVLTPSTIAIANDLGLFLVEAKRYVEGVKILESVLAADSNRTVAYLNLGDAYAGTGKAVEAKAQYHKYCNQMEKAGMGDKIPARIKALNP